MLILQLDLSIEDTHGTWIRCSILLNSSIEDTLGSWIRCSILLNSSIEDNVEIRYLIFC